MEETTFFNEGGLTVTNSRFVVPGQTYAMSGVTSIRTEEYPPSRKWPGIITGLGVLLLLGGKDTIIGALILIAIGVVWWRSQKTTYTVVLSSASGETDAFTSTDEEYVRNLVNALNDAIVSRG
jgi:hypothetical protein